MNAKIATIIIDGFNSDERSDVVVMNQYNASDMTGAVLK
jgi:hypothetical protein